MTLCADGKSPKTTVADLETRRSVTRSDRLDSKGRLHSERGQAQPVEAAIVISMQMRHDIEKQCSYLPLDDHDEHSGRCISIHIHIAIQKKKTTKVPVSDI